MKNFVTKNYIYTNHAKKSSKYLHFHHKISTPSHISILSNAEINVSLISFILFSKCTCLLLLSAARARQQRGAKLSSALYQTRKRVCIFIHTALAHYWCVDICNLLTLCWANSVCERRDISL